MRTDWSKRTDAAAFLNMKEDGSHVPGPHPDLVPFLAKERDVIGWGSEGVGTDAGQAFRFDPPFPVPQHHARQQQVRPGEPGESRSTAAEGRDPDHAAAQDRERLGQPVPCAGAGFGG